MPPENATGNYVKVVQRVPVKIVFDDPQQVRPFDLGPGMSVVPVVKVDSASPANIDTFDTKPKAQARERLAARSHSG